MFKGKVIKMKIYNNNSKIIKNDITDGICIVQIF